MTYYYFKGFNDALNGVYNNPFAQNPALFMQYHNGHNSGEWHKRTKIAITLF